MCVTAMVPPEAAVSWSAGPAAYDQSPAVSPHSDAAALPHCDWSGSRLLSYESTKEGLLECHYLVPYASLCWNMSSTCVSPTPKAICKPSAPIEQMAVE